MANQTTLLPEIDREATKERVEEALEVTRLYRQFGMVRREMQITPAYIPRYHGETNKVGKAAEDIAVSNADTEQRYEQLAESVEKAVRRLRFKEREIIQQTYLADDPEPKHVVCGALHVSERTLFRIQSVAIYQLAFALKLQVFVDDAENA